MNDHPTRRPPAIPQDAGRQSYRRAMTLGDQRKRKWKRVWFRFDLRTMLPEGLFDVSGIIAE